MPPKRRIPQRYEDGGLSSGYHSDTAEHHFKLIYFEVLELSVSCIEQRFDQPGYKIYKQLEKLLSNAASCEDYRSLLPDIVNFYGTNFDAI